MKNWWDALQDALDETIGHAEKPDVWIQGYRQGWIASINHMRVVFKDELDRHDAREAPRKPGLWRRIALFLMGGKD